MLREVICAQLRWRRLSAAADVTCPIAPHRLEEKFVRSLVVQPSKLGTICAHLASKRHA